MAKRRNMNDWLSTKPGKAAVRAIAFKIDNIAIEEKLTSQQVDEVMKSTLEAMGLAYGGGYLDGYDFASARALNKAKG